MHRRKGAVASGISRVQPRSPGRSQTHTTSNSSSTNNITKQYAFAAPALLPFPQWQARQLVSRDLSSGVALLLTYVIFFWKTVPDICGAVANMQQQQTLLDTCSGVNQEGWPVMYRYLCSQPEDLVSAAPRRLQPAAALAAKLVLGIARAVVTWLDAAVISHDPLHTIVPVLRLAALLLPLVHLPYPNLAALWAALKGRRQQGGSASRGVISWYHPSTYWQHPGLRYGVIIAQRLVPAAVAAICKSAQLCDSRWFVVFMGRTTMWGAVGKYAFQGWLAWSLVLPLHLHLMVNIFEWLVNILVYAHRAPEGSVDFTVCGMILDVPYMLSSFVCVIIIPSFAVMWFDKGQQEQYQRLQQQHSAQETAAASAAKEVEAETADSSGRSMPGGSLYGELKQQKQHTPSSSSSDRIGLADDPRRSTSSPPPESQAAGSSCGSSAVRSISNPLAAAAAAPAPSGEGSHDTLCEQLLADINSSLQLAAAAPHKQPQIPSIDLLEAATVAAGLAGHGSSSSRGILPDLSGLRPAISSLLADEAAEVFAAAADAAAAGAVPYYTGIAGSLPVSLKVHTPHNQQQLSVRSLGPVLTSALHYQLSPYNTAAAPLAIASACFEGCVHLIANVLGLRSQLNSDHEVSYSVVTTASLENGRDTAALARSAAAGSSSTTGVAVNSSDLAASLLQAVSSNLQHDCVDTARNSAAGAPEIDIAVGCSAASTHGCTSNGSSVSKGALLPTVSVLCCDPACLITGQDQEIELSLKLSGPQQQQPSCQNEQDTYYAGDDHSSCRVLIISGGAVVLDVDVSLSELTRVKLPAQTSGVLHLALLRRLPATGAGAAAAQSHAPLLLLPLLVLPEGAAQELQAYWCQAMSAAANGGRQIGDNSGSSSVGKAAAWCYSVLPLCTDIAYILGAVTAVQAAAADTGSKRRGKLPLPPGVKLVLHHLLVHLARCKMWHVMQYVVETAAEVFTSQSADGDASAGTSASAAAGSSSSSQCNSENGKMHQKQVAADAPIVALQGAAAAPCTLSSSKPISIKEDYGSSSKPKATAGSPAADDDDDTSDISWRRVTAAELLWGFADPDLESSYKAASYSNTATIDGITCVFYSIFGFGAYRAKGAAAILGEQGSGGLLMFNEVLCFVLNVWGPVAVMLLRWRVSQRLKQLQQQQQQQQQEGTAEECCTSDCASNSNNKTAASSNHSQQQQHQPAAAATAALVRAALLKDQLSALYVILILAWGVLLLCDCGWLIMPVVLTKTWSKRGWAQDLGAFVSLAIRGCTTHVPFSWFTGLSVVQILLNVWGSVKYGLTPRYWLVVRYVPLLLVTLGMNALLHVQGRRRFCTRHKVVVC